METAKTRFPPPARDTASHSTCSLSSCNMAFSRYRTVVCLCNGGVSGKDAVAVKGQCVSERSTSHEALTVHARQARAPPFCPLMRHASNHCVSDAHSLSLRSCNSCPTPPPTAFFHPFRRACALACTLIAQHAPPPWMSFVLRLLVPEQKSSRSTSATRRPGH